MDVRKHDHSVVVVHLNVICVCSNAFVKTYESRWSLIIKNKVMIRFGGTRIHYDNMPMQYRCDFSWL